MPIYVIVAYVIFCSVPLGLGILWNVRYRRLIAEIGALQNEVASSGVTRGNVVG
jgi:hypothetical protein